jgi:hypothetical protein
MLPKYRKFHLGDDMKLDFLGLAAAVAVLASGPSAFAFQLVNPDTNSDGTSTKFSTELDQQHTPTPNSRFQFNDSGNANTTTMKFGNTTLQFGMTGGSGSNYGPSPAIQEKFLQSPAARTVPSQGGW